MRAVATPARRLARVVREVLLACGLIVGVGVAAAWAPGPAVADCATVVCAQPGIESVSATAVSPTTAQVTATIDTGGADTSYQVQVLEDVDGQASSVPQSPQGGVVPGVLVRQTVSQTFTGLSPAETYLFVVRADNGDAEASNQAQLTMPPLPAQSVTLRIARAQTPNDRTDELTAVVDQPGVGEQPELERATAQSGPYERYDAIQPSDPHVFTYDAGLDHNAWYRVHMFGVGDPDGSSSPRVRSFSAPVFVEVWPAISLKVYCHAGGFKTNRCFADAGYSVPQGSSLGRPRAYYYERAGRGSWRRIAQGPIVTTEDGTFSILYFSDPRLDPPREQFMVCTRHALLADMGAPFDFAACGRPSLTRITAPRLGYGFISHGGFAS